MNELRRKTHNKFAPYWAAAMIVFAVAGISTNWVDGGAFWKGYVLDIFGPAWNYILFRNLGAAYKENKWRSFFTPLRTLVIFVLVLFAIEGMQFLEWYDSTFDPLDLLAYLSLMIPLYLLDVNILRRADRSEIDDVNTG